MSEFGVYLELGFKHITDLYGFDHILFIIALCSTYLIKDWRQVLILVTSFTIGHSITLALASLDFVQVNSDLIEFLIPITIMLTAMYNLTIKFKRDIFKTESDKVWPRYLVAIVFGLIHGLGFSNYLRSLLGKSSSIFSQLLAFNIGLEVGQVLIVIALLALSFIVVDLGKINRNRWNWVVSAIVLGMALMLAIDKSEAIF